MDAKLLMQVEKSVSLTGLGVLLVPKFTAPLLSELDLHTQWMVELVFPDGTTEVAAASIEEITRPAELSALATSTRALLLTQEQASPISADTLVYKLE